MPQELQPWGGDVQMPRWLRRILRRPIDPGPTRERQHEARKPQEPSVSVLENADRAIFGGFSDGHAGNRPPHR